MFDQKLNKTEKRVEFQADVDKFKDHDLVLIIEEQNKIVNGKTKEVCIYI